MKPKFRSHVLLTSLVVALGGAPLAMAQWNGAGVTGGTTSQNISDSANWAGGTINGNFTPINTVGAHNLVLSGNLTLTALNFDVAASDNSIVLGTITGGTGYATAPTTTVTTTGAGTGATATSTVTAGGAVNAVTIGNHGTGYFGATLPTFVFGGPGTGASRPITGALPTGSTNITLNSDTAGVKRTISFAGAITPQDRSDSSLTFGEDLILDLTGNSTIGNSGGNFNQATNMTINGEVRSTAAGTQSLTKNLAGTLTFGATSIANIDGGFVNTVGTTVFDGLVAGTGGITNSNSGSVITLSNAANSFSGTVIANSAVINTVSIGNVGQNSGLGSGNQIILNGGTLNVSGNGTHTSNRAISGNTTVTLRNTGTGTSALVFTGGTFTSTNTAAATLRLGGTNTSSVNIFAYDVADGPAVRHLGIGQDGGDGNTVWRVTGNNTFTGNVTVARGSLEFTSAAALGNNAGIVLSNISASNLRYVGTGDANVTRAISYSNTGSSQTTTLTANGIGTITYSGATMTASNQNVGKTLTLTGFNTGNNRISSNILRGTDGTGSSTNLNKTGAGTWVLSGANTIGAAASGAAGTITASNGRLVFDYGTNANVWSVASNVNMNGGSLEILGNSGAATNTALTLGNVATTSNTGFSQIAVDANGGASTTLTLGTITRNVGTALLFDLSGGGKVTTTSTLTNNLFASGGHILVRSNDSATGVDYASKNASNEIVALGATTALPAATGSSTTNYRLSGSHTLTGATSVNTLRVDTTGGGTLDIGTNNFTTTSGSMFVGSGDYTLTSSGAGTIGNAGTLVLNHFGTGTLTLSASLGSGTGSVFLVNGGSGLINWTSAAATSGSNQLLGGVVRVGLNTINYTNAATGNGSGVLRLASGTILELQGDLNRNIGTGSGAVEFVGNGGFSAFGVDRTVTLAANAPLTWGQTNFVTDTFILGSNYSDSTLIFTNDIAFATLSRVFEVNAGVNDRTDARLTGVLSSTGGGLVKTGAGKLEVTGANTYTGDTWVMGGQLFVSNTTGSGTGTGDVRLAASTTLAGTGTISGTITGAGTIAPGASPGILTVGAVNASEGLSFLFQMTALNPNYGARAASGNDVLHITSATPFTTALNAGNVITVDFTGMSLNIGDVIYGGIFASTDFSASVANATVNYVGLNGLTANMSVVSQSADFGTGLTNGFVTRFDIIPEPSSMLLTGLGISSLLLRRRRNEGA